jgi:hypothetical protein
MTVFRLFEVPIDYLDACGDIAIDMTSGDADRTLQLHLYLYHMVRRSDYLDGLADFLTRPERYPEALALPHEISPPGAPMIITSHMDAEYENFYGILEY